MVTKEEVLAFIKENGLVTCVKLTDKFGSGDCALCASENVIIAYDITHEMFDILTELTKTKQIMPFPATVIDFLNDGDLPLIPVSYSVPPTYAGYVWEPTFFCEIKTGIEYIKIQFADDPDLPEILELLEKDSTPSENHGTA